MTSLRRRLANAACAFETGHSVRDLDRVWRRRIAIHANRVADRKEKNAEGAPDHAKLRLTSEASALREAAHRYVKSLDRFHLPVLLKSLYLDRICQRSFWWNEPANLEFLQSPDHSTAGSFEPGAVPTAKFPGQFYEGFLEKRGFDLSFDDHLVGRWNWHRFLRFVCRSVSTGVRQIVRDRALAVVRACGPP